MQLNKLKSGIKIGTEVSLKRSSDVAGDSNDENNFPHKFLLTNTGEFQSFVKLLQWYISLYKIIKKSTA